MFLESELLDQNDFSNYNEYESEPKIISTKYVFNLILTGQRKSKWQIFHLGPKTIEGKLGSFTNFLGQRPKLAAQKKSINVSIKMDYKEPNRIKVGSEYESVACYWVSWDESSDQVNSTNMMVLM